MPTTPIRPSEEKPLVSLIVPGYNEESIIEASLTELCRYMETLADRYRWEILVVNDGSTDRTGEFAEAFAKTHEHVRVLHHPYNFRLGQALRYGFREARGDYVVTLDMDLSYAPDHIERMLTTLCEQHAKIVLASPYMKGGQVSNVPWLRKMFSVWANKFLSLTVTKDRLTGRLSTLTGMVRAYDGHFLSRLNLKAMEVDINTEILYKAMILRARIVEIPAHLNWREPRHAVEGPQRKSSMRIQKAILASLLSGFMFRPFMFFILPGLIVILLAFYTLLRALVYSISEYIELSATQAASWGKAIAYAFQDYPHIFIVGGFGLMVAVQLLSLGILALQNKKYYEELFHLNTTIYGNLLDLIETSQSSSNKNAQ